MWNAVELAGFFLHQVVLSTLRVAWDVVTPKARARPGIVAVPLDLRSNGGVTLLATLITLTPGTLALDLSEDRRFLYVHSMFIRDADSERAKIKRRLESRVRKVLE